MVQTADEEVDSHDSPPALPSTSTRTFVDFADLFGAADPSTHAEKALIAGYWLQVCQGAESFDSQSANKELKNLGHGLPNITHALTSLKETKPALVQQLRKSGSSQQARKTYRVTVGVIDKVKGMVNG